MCDANKVKAYGEKWDDFFSNVSSGVYTKLLLNDEVYIGFGAHNGLEVEDLKFWYKDAERARIPAVGDAPSAWVEAHYGVHGDEDFIQDKIDTLVRDGEIYEANGYWFTNE